MHVEVEQHEPRSASLGLFNVTRDGVTMDFAVRYDEEGCIKPQFRFRMPPEAWALRVMLLGHAGVGDQPPLMANFDVARANPGTRANTLTLRCEDTEGRPFDLRTGRLVLFSLRPTAIEVEFGWEGPEDAFQVLGLSNES